VHSHNQSEGRPKGKVAPPLDGQELSTKSSGMTKTYTMRKGKNLKTAVKYPHEF